MSGLVLVFLVAFMAVNFADKAILGLAAASIMREFHLNHAQFGAIGSAFFALFSLSAFFVGSLGDRARQRSLLATLAFFWSVAQGLAAAAPGAVLLAASRVVLGAAEGPAFPLALHSAYTTGPAVKRANLTGFVLAGVPLGTALTALLLTPVIVRFGWRTAFVVLAVASLLWAAGWFAVMRVRKPAALTAGAQRVSLHVLVGNRTTLGAMLASFAIYLVNGIALVWYPKVLEGGVGLSASQAGVFLGIAWASQIPTCVLSGWFMSRLAARTAEPGALYARIAVVSVALTGIAIAGMSLFSSLATVAVCLLVTLLAGIGAFIVLGPLVAEVAPSPQRATALGAFAAVYAIGGIVGPWLFGVIVDRNLDPVAGYRVALLGLGALIVLAAVLAALLMQPSADRLRLMRSEELAS